MLMKIIKINLHRRSSQFPSAVGRIEYPAHIQRKDVLSEIISANNPVTARQTRCFGIITIYCQNFRILKRNESCHRFASANLNTDLTIRYKTSFPKLQY